MLQTIPDLVEYRDDLTVIVDADYITYLVAALSQHKQPVPHNGEQEVRQNSEGESFWVDPMWLVDWRIANEFQKIAQLTRVEVERMTVYLTPTGSNTFRDRLAVTKPYKGNRKQAKPILYSYVRAKMMEHPNAREAEDCEADDLCAMKQIQCIMENQLSVVVSPDKDAKNVPGVLLNPRKGTVLHVSPEQAAFNFWSQMVTGDTADNIPGLPRRGPAWLDKLLTRCPTWEELSRAVRAEYLNLTSTEYMLEQGRLLHMQRFPGQMWTPGDEFDAYAYVDTQDLWEISNDIAQTIATVLDVDRPRQEGSDSPVGGCRPSGYLSVQRSPRPKVL